jgi:hypothetical protein
MCDQPAQEALLLITEAEFQQLVQDANSGNAESLAALRKCLDLNPMIWQRLGDLALHAELTLIKLVAGGDQLAIEALTRKTHELKAELAGPNPSPLERLAAERVIACWLQLQFVDSSVLTTDATALAQSKCLLQRQELASRRYQSAMKSLLDIRRYLPGAARNQEPHPGSPSTLHVYNAPESEATATG